MLLFRTPQPCGMGMHAICNAWLLLLASYRLARDEASRKDRDVKGGYRLASLARTTLLFVAPVRGHLTFRLEGKLV